MWEVKQFISSLQNDKIKNLISLKKSSQRSEQKKFVIEGYREITRYMHSLNGKQDLQFFICPELIKEDQISFAQQIEASNYKIFELPFKVFEKCCYRENPDGWMLVAPLIYKGLDNLKLSSNPLIVLAQSIEKPGNLGTILRSCDGAGVDAVIVCDKITDIYNPNVIRASLGVVFCIPVIQATTEQAKDFIQKNHLHVVSATPSASKTYTDYEWNQATVLAVGNEPLGLSESWLTEDCEGLKIPMLGVSDSLNVAMATGLMVYEALRQRTSHG